MRVHVSESKRSFVRVRDREIVRRSEKVRFRDYASGVWGVCCVCEMCVREREEKKRRESLGVHVCLRVLHVPCECV